MCVIYIDVGVGSHKEVYLVRRFFWYSSVICHCKSRYADFCRWLVQVHVQHRRLPTTFIYKLKGNTLTICNILHKIFFCWHGIKPMLTGLTTKKTALLTFFRRTETEKSQTYFKLVHPTMIKQFCYFKTLGMDLKSLRLPWCEYTCIQFCELHCLNTGQN